MKFPLILIAFLTTSFSAFAQTQNTVVDTEPMGWSIGVAIGAPGRWGNVVPTLQFRSGKIANISDENWRGEAAVSYDPREFGHVRLEYLPDDLRSDNTQVYVIVPALGDFRLRPTHNELSNPVLDSFTANYSYGGAGVRFGDAQIAANFGMKSVAIVETFPPESPAAQYAEISSESGVGFEGGMQLIASKRFTIGISGQGARYRIDRENSNELIDYYDAEGTAYARIRIVDNGKVQLELNAEYFARVTNLTESGTRRKVAFPLFSIRARY